MTHVHYVPAANPLEVTHKLDALGWGLFFLWVGVALMANIGWGLGLLGVGVLALVGQVARKHFGLAVERFWVIVGVFLVLGAVWDLVGLQFSLVPFVLIAAGMTLLFSAARRHSA